MIIWAIAKLDYLRLLKNKSLIAIGSFLIACSLISMAFKMTFQGFGADLPLNQNPMWTLHVWSFFATLFCIFTASGLFSREIKDKTFTPVVTRPVHLWEYQLGKWLGLFITYLTVLAISIVLIFLKSLIYETDLPDHFILELIEMIIDAGCAIAIVFSLGLVCSKYLSLAIFFGVIILGGIMKNIQPGTHWLFDIVKICIYAVTPAERVLDVTHFDTGQAAHYGKFLLQNLCLILYATCTLILSNAYYYKRDYPIRDA